MEGAAERGYRHILIKLSCPRSFVRLNIYPSPLLLVHGGRARELLPQGELGAVSPAAAALRLHLPLLRPQVRHLEGPRRPPERAQAGEEAPPGTAGRTRLPGSA